MESVVGYITRNLTKMTANVPLAVEKGGINMDRDIKADAIRLGMQAALMRELVQTPMWKCYAEYVQTMLDDWVDRVMTGTKDEFEYRKGVVMGLRDALRVPENIITWAERANRN